MIGNGINIWCFITCHESFGQVKYYCVLKYFNINQNRILYSILAFVVANI